MSNSNTARELFASPPRAKKLYLVNESSALNNRAEEAAFHAALDDLFFQFEVRDAVDQQAARAVVPVINGDAVSG